MFERSPALWVKLATTSVRAAIDLRLDERLSPDRVRAQQLVRLQSLLETAARAEHYREVLGEIHGRSTFINSLEEFAQVPVLTKEQVRAAGARLYTNNIVPRDAVEVSTTGSTGVPLRYLLTRRELTQERLSIAYGFYKHGLNATDLCATLEVPKGDRPAAWIQGLGIARIISIDLRRGSRVAARILRATRPQVIYSYPSVLSLLALEELTARPLGYRPRVVVTHGEILNAATRELVVKAFDAAVYDTYGAAECFRIAFECAWGLYHVIPSTAFVEVDKSTLAADGSAELLLTSLTRHHMPLIRYRMGDRAIPAHDPCMCGCPFPALLSITGRTDDLLTMPSGRRVSARAINMLEDVPGLVEYQIVQTTTAHFVVRARTNATFDSSSEMIIVEAIRRGCTPDRVTVSIQIVDDLRRMPNGKLRAVISET